MAQVILPRSLADLFPGAPRRLTIEAGTLDELITGLDERWPGMRDRLCEPGPALRAYINVFVDRERGSLDTVLGPESEVRVVPSIAGG